MEKHVWKQKITDWFNYAKSNSDPLLQFLCYYMVLNFLFSLTGRVCRKKATIEITKNDRTKEKVYWTEPTAFEGIPRLLVTVLPYIDFNISTIPHETLDGPIEQCGTRWIKGPKNDKGHWKTFNPKMDIRYRSEIMQTIHIDLNDPIWNSIDCFLKISIVRNNLFHCWKSPAGPEESIETKDMNLINESIAVLRPFLTEVLKMEKLPFLLDEMAESHRFG